jgi:hypothetical protein
LIQGGFSLTKPSTPSKAAQIEKQLLFPESVLLDPQLWLLFGMIDYLKL